MKVNLVGELPEGVEPSVVAGVESAVNQTNSLPKVIGEINLKLVTDAEIAQLNRQYAGIDSVTDVLSFPYDGPEATGQAELGDVAISIDTAARQAAEAGTHLADELGTLLVHGILHILGYDHHTKADRLMLDRLQAGIIETAGLKYRKIDWKS